MNLVGKLSFWLVMAAAMSGCATRSVDRRVIVADNLVNRLEVTDVRCSRSTGDYLTFQARVANTWAHDLGIEWRVCWLTDDGIEVSPETQVWRKLVIAPKDVTGLKATAPQPTVTDARFYVRKLRK